MVISNRTEKNNGLTAILSSDDLETDFVFEIADKFFSEKAEKAFQLTFDDRNELCALKHQIKFGKFDEAKSTPPGFFDFVGRKRIACWKALGDMNADVAKQAFVNKIQQLCPLFQTYLEAYCRNSSSCPNTESVKESTVDVCATDFLIRNEAEIRMALSAQTKRQFEVYAAQQFPDDVEKQRELIRSLQDRHFHEYVNYLRHELTHTVPESGVSKTSPPQNTSTEHPTEQKAAEQVSAATQQPNPKTTNHDDVEAPTTANDDSVSTTTIEEAGMVSPSVSMLVSTPVMWTREDVAQLKQQLGQSNESVERIGSGEMITIRVPTASMGTRIFWEFVTDDYDIAFGLFFEWPQANGEKQNGIAGESENETEQTEIKPSVSAESESSAVDELVPITRRNSHLEVQCGSHLYPGIGTYLFRFDNSYSLWRAKTLYYRMLYAS